MLVITAGPQDSDWHHYLVTVDLVAEELRVYLDGALTASDNGGLTANAWSASAGALTFSSRDAGEWDNGAPFSVDEMGLYYGVALDAADAAAHYNGGTPVNLNDPSTPGQANLAHYWRMGDGAADTTSSIADQVGSADLTVNDVTGFVDAAPNNDVFGRYAWLYSYSAEQADASDWPSETAGSNLSAVNGSPLVDQNTGSLDAEALGPRRVDQAVAGVSPDVNYSSDAKTLDVPDTGDLTFRILVRRPATQPASVEAFRLINTGAQWTRFYAALADNERMDWYLRSENITPGFTLNSSIYLPLDEWYLVDLVLDRANVAHVLQVNGQRITGDQEGGSVNFGDNPSDFDLSLLGQTAGGNVWEGPLVFWGLLNRDLGLDDHRLDAYRLGLSNVIDVYARDYSTPNVNAKAVWDLAWDAKDATPTEWPAAFGTGTLAEPTAGWDTPPTLDQPTVGLADAALGAARVDRAVLYDDTDPNVSGFSSEANDDVVLPESTEAHFRLIFDDASGVPDGANGRMFEYIISGIRFLRFTYVGDNGPGSHQLSFGVRDDPSGGTAGGVSTTVLIPQAGLQGLLIDVVVRNVGGVTRLDVLWNGTEVVGTAHDALLRVGINGFNPGVGVFCTRSGDAAVPWRGIFCGYRAGHTLSLEEHRADARALGLY